MSQRTKLGLELVKPVHGFPSPLRSLAAANPSSGNPARPFPRVLHTGEGAASALRIGQKLDMRKVGFSAAFAPRAPPVPYIPTLFSGCSGN